MNNTFHGIRNFTLFYLSLGASVERVRSPEILLMVKNLCDLDQLYSDLFFP